MGKSGFVITGVTTQTGVTVTIADTSILAANPKRHGFILVNDGANVVYLSLGTGAAVANSGIRLNANGGALQLDANSLWIGPVRGIAVGGSSVVTVLEF